MIMRKLIILTVVTYFKVEKFRFIGIFFPKDSFDENKIYSLREGMVIISFLTYSEPNFENSFKYQFKGFTSI